jgi:hypothetical protein
MPIKIAGLACLAVLASAGAAMAQPAPAKADSCFYSRDVNNFVAVDNSTVNIRVGVNKVYRLALFAPCTGITFSQGIALVSRPGVFVCSGTANAVDLYIHTSTGRRRCPVTSITPLTAAEVAALPKKQRP